MIDGRVLGFFESFQIRVDKVDCLSLAQALGAHVMIQASALRAWLFCFVSSWTALA